MPYCHNCGTELSEEQMFCLNCGASVKPENTEKSKKGFDLNVGQFVFSIINLVSCCNVVGIITLTLTILAGFADEIKSKQYIKTAKILNIVGVCLGAVAIIAAIVLYFFVIIAVGTTPYYYM